MSKFKKWSLSILLLFPLPFLMGSGQFTVPSYVAAPTAAPFMWVGISGISPSGAGNNITIGNEVGWPYTTQPPAYHVNQLCRYNVSGNSQTHTLYLTDLTAGMQLATVSINASLGTPGTLQCASITPVALTVSHTYWIASCEFNGGDSVGYATTYSLYPGAAALTGGTALGPTYGFGCTYTTAVPPSGSYYTGVNAGLQ